MNDLPDPSVLPTPSSTTAQSFTPGVGKEGEGFTLAPELPLSPVGQEIDPSKEVSSAGVMVHPTTVQLPQAVSNQGVHSVGHNVSPHPTNGSSITLPLTNEQIALAQKESPTLSIRWLAEWCIYKVEKIHAKLTGKHTAE